MNKIILFFVILDLLLFALLGSLRFLFNEEHTLAELQTRRYESRLLAEELRRSSDDLTRMARTYVVTGNPRFLTYFNEIAAIRDGKLPRPDKYENIYWDYICAQKECRGKPGEKISIVNQMRTLQFSEAELNLLREAKALSDELIKMEVQAFNAVEGLYVGDDGTYTVMGKPDPGLAQRILFSDAYHQAKFRIMERIDRFFKRLEARTEKEVQDVKLLQIRYLTIAQLLSVVILGMGTLGFWLFKKDIIGPLNRLSRWIRQMQKGEYTFDAREYKKDEIGMLANAFADMASQVSHHISDLEQVSKTDPLTQINNRITLDKSLLNEMYKFERYGTPCSVIMLDVDLFKRVNDQYGHLAGDRVLIGIARILTAGTRRSDIVGRWGGEEFLIVCPQTDLKGGRALAELLRRHIAEHEFETLHVTVSLGVSEFETGVSAEETVKKADQLMYQAKGEGRNRVC